MWEVKSPIERFFSAARKLPEKFLTISNYMDDISKAEAEEFRLRIGRPISITTPRGEYVPCQELIVEARDLSDLLRIASMGSVHSFSESLRWGYITAEGGHRVGICGTAVVKNGEVTGVRNLSSASIRIAKEVKGIGEDVYRKLYTSFPYPNTLIISPPGGGKTTLLRDLIRIISNSGIRVSAADEKNEISAMHSGVPGLDIGTHTDVIEGCAKSAALMMLLRSMNPQIIAADEITVNEDIRVMEGAAHCGVGLLATIHADNLNDLRKRGILGAVSGIFDKAVFISGSGNSRQYMILEDWDV